MALGLTTGSPSLDKGEPDLTPQQERALEVEQNRASLGQIEQKVDTKLESNNIFSQYPEETKSILKDALVKECYVEFGSNPNITDVNTYHDKNGHSIEIEIDRVLDVSISPERVLENYKLSHPEFDLEGTKLKLAELGHDMDVSKVFTSLMKEVDALKNAVESATDNRESFIAYREEERANAGFLNRFLGKAPEPIPSIEEVPLSRAEIEKHIKPELLGSESLQRLLTAQLENTTIVLGEKDGVLKDVVNSSLGLGEAAAVTVYNTGWDMPAAAGALGHGLLQFTKEGSIEDATRVAKESYKYFSGQVHQEMSANAKKTVDENYILQGAGYALEKTVVPVIEALNETLPEPVVVFGGLALTAIPSGKSLVNGKSVGLRTSVSVIEKVNDFQQRVNKVRESMPTTRLAKQANVAIADVKIEGVKKEFLANSGIHSSLDKGANLFDFSFTKEKPFFKKYVEDVFPRLNDTEAKILEDIASKIKDKPNIKGSVDLYTDLPPCKSCSNIISEFKEVFPNVELNVYDKTMK